MINIALCDDDVIFLDKFKPIIEQCFKKFTYDFVIKDISDGKLLLSEHSRKPFDIIFLDIDMPYMNGFDVARTLRENFSQCFIIFITNHAELVYESMDFQPFNFIRKSCNIPIEESTEKVINKLIRHMKQNEKVILEDDISGRKAVYIKNIIYIESDRHYVYYHILNMEEPIKMRENMTKCEQKYEKYDFVKIHKKYFVNMRFIHNIDTKTNKIILRGIKAIFPLGRTHRKPVDEKYTLFLRAMI